VCLWKLERRPNVGSMLLRLDFSKDVAPWLLFLKEIGVEDSRLGYIISHNPFILSENLDNLQARPEILLLVSPGYCVAAWSLSSTQSSCVSESATSSLSILEKLSMTQTCPATSPWTAWLVNMASRAPGLLYEDTLYEDADVKEALRRLPENVSNDRTFRIKRALDLSMKQQILPKDQWTKYEEVRSQENR
ncbi:hypothetical protein XENOCAPTIV_001295, partial [Xenoophorus captivus]